MSLYHVASLPFISVGSFFWDGYGSELSMSIGNGITAFWNWDLIHLACLCGMTAAFLAIE